LEGRERAYNQSTSSIAAVDSFNLREQYGPQSFDQRVIFNTFIVYQIPYYRERTVSWAALPAGGRSLPSLQRVQVSRFSASLTTTARTLAAKRGYLTGSNENCIFTSPYSGGRLQTYRNVA
jgi:hypothetical protein